MALRNHVAVDVISFGDDGPMLRLGWRWQEEANFSQRCFKYIVCRVGRQKRRERNVEDRGRTLARIFIDCRRCAYL
jgi:hypothetical protein